MYANALEQRIKVLEDRNWRGPVEELDDRLVAIEHKGDPARPPTPEVDPFAAHRAKCNDPFHVVAGVRCFNGETVPFIPHVHACKRTAMDPAHNDGFCICACGATRTASSGSEWHETLIVDGVPQTETDHLRPPCAEEESEEAMSSFDTLAERIRMLRADSSARLNALEQRIQAIENTLAAVAPVPATGEQFMDALREAAPSLADVSYCSSHFISHTGKCPSCVLTQPAPAQASPGDACAHCSHWESNHFGTTKNHQPCQIAYCGCSFFVAPPPAPAPKDDGGWTTLGSLQPGEIFGDANGNIGRKTRGTWCAQFVSAGGDAFLVEPHSDQKVRRLVTLDPSDPETVERATSAIPFQQPFENMKPYRLRVFAAILAALGERGAKP
jgi:hypothetical protein